MKHYLKIYSKLPSYLQRLLFNYKARKDFVKRFGGNFDQYYSELKRLWTSDLQDIQEFQLVKVRSLLRDAYLYSNWYKNIMNESGISLTSIDGNPLKVLKQLPFLEKDEIRNNLNEIVSNNPSIKTGGVNYTSGTT